MPGIERKNAHARADCKKLLRSIKSHHRLSRWFLDYLNGNPDWEKSIGKHQRLAKLFIRLNIPGVPDVLVELQQFSFRFV